MSRRTTDYHKLGNVYDRHRRVEWMIATFGSSTGKTIKCFHCPKVMHSRPARGQRHWEIDRYPICGHDGGRYVRGNIVPSCRRCNVSRCTVALKCRRGAKNQLTKHPQIR